MSKEMRESTNVVVIKDPKKVSDLRIQLGNGLITFGNAAAGAFVFAQALSPQKFNPLIAFLGICLCLFSYSSAIIVMYERNR